jgi:hypothetical protein
MVGMNNGFRKDVEGRYLGLTETVSQNFLEATEVNKEKPQPS